MARTDNRPRHSSPLNLMGAFELFRPSRQLVMKNIWIFGPLYGVMLIFAAHTWLYSPATKDPNHHWWSGAGNLASGWSGSTAPTYLTAAIIGFGVVWLIFTLAVGTIAKIMTQAAQLEAAEGRHLNFDKLWRTTQELGWRMFGLYLLTALFVGIGLILFIIPGIIMLRRYFLAPYVMLDKKCSITEAMQTSAKMSKPYSTSIYSIIIVMLLIGLISVIPFIGILISFFLGMLYSVAPALRYQELKKLS